MNNWLYILDGREPVHFDRGFVAWTIWMADHNTTVAIDIIGEARVSTVFCRHGSPMGRKPKPVVFETMVFGWERDFQMRYATWDEALAKHAVVLARVRASLQ